MTAYRLPVRNFQQTFTISLVGVIYTLTLKWNKYSNAWELDIGDSQNNPILLSVPLVTGADLLEQFEYLLIGGGLFATTDHSPDTPPTFDNLGSTGKLFFVT